MHILYATQAYKPAYRVGGPVLSVSATAEELARRGHEVTVITSAADLDRDLDVPLNQPTQVDGVNVWYFRRSRGLQRRLSFIPYLSNSAGFLYSPEIKGVLDALMPRVDVVHTQVPYVYPALAAGRAAIRYGKPLIYQQRGCFLPEALRRRRLKKRVYLRMFEHGLMCKAARLIALTNAEVESYRALGVRTPCEVIPNGVHVAEYGHSKHQPALPVPSSQRFILFLGRLHEIKGVDILIKAFARAHLKIPDVSLVLAGPDELGLEKVFRKMAQDENIADRVFFPGMVGGEFKRALLARASIFCLPSKTEGFSVAVLEALASGTPVLLSPGCNFSEPESVGAGLVIPSEPNTLGTALVELLSSPEKLAEMGRSARAFVERSYTWESIVDRLTAVYTHACTSPHQVSALQDALR